MMTMAPIIHEYLKAKLHPPAEVECKRLRQEIKSAVVYLTGCLGSPSRKVQEEGIKRIQARLMVAVGDEEEELHAARHPNP
jgi:hypothetical protein